MGQSRAVAATTDTRRSVHAARALVMLGGFVVLWFGLSTGTASAEEGPDPLRETTTAVATTLERVAEPVRAAVSQPPRASRPAPQSAPRPTAPTTHQTAPEQPVVKVVQAASPVVSAVRETVRNTVAATPVAPVLDAVTTSVRVQLQPTLERTRELLQATPAAPLLDGLEAAPAQDLPLLSAADTLADRASGTAAPAANQSAANDVHLTDTHLANAHLADFLVQPDAAPAGVDQAAPVTETAPAEPSSDHALGSLPGAGSAQIQSGSGSGPAAAVVELGVFVPAAGTVVSTSSFADVPPAGPAYPPAASPD